ncbi:hypothetical protein AAFF_G00062960 [Aldrovandia affinis]|uniref:Gypsy retrotransposon integrase-like protein 1 n=1 Tax=Aldrovandia affinis TaxID=143900 RepID=A0AAD7WEP4_9TELE|nr:hypothetical protein AAFF_G00062960 [Aldrovandia affinis]
MDASLRKAREAVFWPGIADDVKSFVNSCATYNSTQSRQQRETLIPHQLPHIPWSKLFAQEWDFNHETSSPYNSQSNGKAESAVKIAKTLLKRLHWMEETHGKQSWHGGTPQRKALTALLFKGLCQDEHAPSCLPETHS